MSMINKTNTSFQIIRPTKVHATTVLISTFPFNYNRTSRVTRLRPGLLHLFAADMIFPGAN